MTNPGTYPEQAPNPQAAIMATIDTAMKRPDVSHAVLYSDEHVQEGWSQILILPLDGEEILVSKSFNHTQKDRLDRHIRIPGLPNPQDTLAQGTRFIDVQMFEDGTPPHIVKVPLDHSELGVPVMETSEREIILGLAESMLERTLEANPIDSKTSPEQRERSRSFMGLLKRIVPIKRVDKR
jgi:hypothetical protein